MVYHERLRTLLVHIGAAAAADCGRLRLLTLESTVLFIGAVYQPDDRLLQSSSQLGSFKRQTNEPFSDFLISTSNADH